MSIAISSRPPAVSVRELGKSYERHANPRQRLKRLLLGRSEPQDPFWALRGVSFDVNPGEVFGVVGRNGAGKSTMLQILARVLKPTEGVVQTAPRICGLLELGSGFNPDYSGLENIYLNCAILGLSRTETHARLDAICSFADVGRFIDEPVRTYSTGMMLRLAFAVTTAIEPEVMLVDEALAVGDVFFRQKCYGRLEALRERGTAIVLVTHSLGDISQFCERAMVLEHGRPLIVTSGTEAVEFFYQRQQQQEFKQCATAETLSTVLAEAGTGWPEFWPATLPRECTIPGTQTSMYGVECVAIAITDDRDIPKNVFEQGHRMRVYAAFRTTAPLQVPLLGLSLRNEQGLMIHGKNSLNFSLSLPHGVAAGSLIVGRQEVTLDLGPAEYTLEIGCGDIAPSVFERRAELGIWDIVTQARTLCSLNEAAVVQVIPRARREPCSFSHFGAVDLPGGQEVAVVDPAVLLVEV